MDSDATPGNPVPVASSVADVDPDHNLQNDKPAGKDAAAAKADISEDIDPANEVQGTKLVLIHVAICLCAFLVGLDFNLIATAVPVITTEFDSTRDIGWYGASFMVAMAASQPLGGKLYTLFPKKMTYLFYLAVFEAGSLVCGLAPSSAALIAGRTIAGFGASGLLAGALTILTTIIPLHRRAVWTGTMGAVFSIASIVGPVIAGGLTQNVTWRWCFYINLPIGGGAAVLILLLVHLNPAESEKKPVAAKLESLDPLGVVLFVGSTTMLLLALQWGGIEYAWSSSVIIGLLVGFGAVMVLFVAWTLRQQENALIPPRLFTVNRNPALICAAAFFVNGAFQMVIYWLPIWFQGVLGNSPTQSGVNFFPTVISDVVTAFVGSAIVSQLGWWNPFLLLAEVCVCLCGGLLTTLYPNISGAHWVGYQILGGVGYSLASHLSHLAMQSSLPQDLVPIGATTVLTVISLSCSIYMAIGQAVFQRQLQVNLEGVVGSDMVSSIINSGVTSVGSLVDASALPTFIEKYSLSVTQVFYIPAVSPVISFLLVLGCKWISTKSKLSPVAAAVSAEKTEADAEKGLGGTDDDVKTKE
ncbi:putative HC-toxin efflux carrier [Achaetomium macrosporum]|uniref:HC-toxin efflux carrier n=1 Tax=Achaetomium macrosporum TaxID=79813 RepID=A0AAN7H7V6_9PEZI|nr:putative HC-toxin efflux carrier [Achaetomium macrosporum]